MIKRALIETAMGMVGVAPFLWIIASCVTRSFMGYPQAWDFFEFMITYF